MSLAQMIEMSAAMLAAGALGYVVGTATSMWGPLDRWLRTFRGHQIHLATANNGLMTIVFGFWFHAAVFMPLGFFILVLAFCGWDEQRNVWCRQRLEKLLSMSRQSGG